MVDVQGCVVVVDAATADQHWTSLRLGGTAFRVIIKTAGFSVPRACEGTLLDLQTLEFATATAADPAQPGAVVQAFH